MIINDSEYLVIIKRSFLAYVKQLQQLEVLTICQPVIEPDINHFK